METREQIRDALVRLMESRQYSQIGIADICKEACVSKKTLYRYYGNKDEIFDAVYVHLFLEPHRKVRESLDVDHIYSMPTLMLESGNVLMLEHREIVENFYRSQGREAWVETVYRSTLGFTRGVLEARGVDESEIDFVAYYVTMALATVKAHWIEGGFEMPPAEMARLARKWILARFDVPI